MISSSGRGSSSEYLSTTYSCSPDRDMIRAPSQQRIVERRVSGGMFSVWCGVAWLGVHSL